MKPRIYILGGGTFAHVRNHLALAAPAFGETARQLTGICYEQLLPQDYEIVQCLTKMADRWSNLVTNEDVEAKVDQIIADPQAKIVFFNVAMTDFSGQVGYIDSGLHADRLQSRVEGQTMLLTAKPKVISKIRQHRKDIFLVAFKTTTGKTPLDQYEAGLRLLKENSCNLVLANDTVTRKNTIITPEESRYEHYFDRKAALNQLVKMAVSRSKCHFTRSTVIEGEAISWQDDRVPASLRTVVDHCIEKGAYKPFHGKTVGHFAVKVGEGKFLTSARKTNFNHLAFPGNGLVDVTSTGKDTVIAVGRKPSVGGQSQRIIFEQHQDLDCIVHFHCPMKVAGNGVIPVAEQWKYECGSHECGENTSRNLKEIEPGISAVYLEEHGPNIVFNRNIDPARVINFIGKYFDLEAKTGGVFSDWGQR